MRAATLVEFGRDLELLDLSVADPAPHEVRVRSVAAGVCHTDLSICEGHVPLPLPMVVGHEPAGVVVAVGDAVVDLAVGDHVIGFASPQCGTCSHCGRDEPYLCTGERTYRLPSQPPRLRAGTEPVAALGGVGAFAEEMLVHQASLVRIAPDLPLELAALLGCGVATGLGAVFNTARLAPGSTVAIIGCGGVGLSAVQAARIAGASRIFAIDLVPEKLALAIELGATDAILASETTAAEVIEATRGGVDAAIECVGRNSTLNQALSMTRRGGTSIMVGLMPFGAQASLPAAEFLLGGKRLLSSVLGETRLPSDIDRYIELWQSGALQLEPLVAGRFALSEVNAALAALGGSGARPVIRFD